jgi:hypothetical protein
MSLLSQSAWLRRLGAAAIMAAGLLVVSAASQPVEARVWVGFNFGFPVYGTPYPVYYPHYYNPYPYGYYRPAYYGPGWRWRHWCWHHPYRCHRW